VEFKSSPQTIYSKKRISDIMAYGQTFEMEDTIDGLDLVYDSTKNLIMLTDSDKVGQDIVFLFKTQVGEDMFNTSFGTNISVILNAKSPDIVIETVIREALIKYRYFRMIKNIKIIDKDYINRTMRVEVSAVFGEENIVFTVVF